MQQTKIKSQTKKQNSEETLKILANFFKKSSAIMEDALKESREKHPDLFKSS